MFIYSENDRRVVNVDQVRSFEVEESNIYMNSDGSWEIIAKCDNPEWSFRLARFDRSPDSDTNKAEAMAILRKLCSVIAKTDCWNAIVDMSSVIEDDFIYDRSK